MKFSNIPIFYYHSVAPAPNPYWRYSFLTTELVYFHDFLKYLSRRGYQFLTLDEYLNFRADPASNKKRMICLTFDDGYLDNYVYVYPLLKKFNAKGTIFVSTGFVQSNKEARPTLEDVWAGKIKESELQSDGFLSWPEMKVMQQSGVIDIQSHTHTHTKYPCSDTIREFHHPGADYLYPVGNAFPEKVPYYIGDSEFARLIPFGTPFFAESSSIITSKLSINKDFTRECVDALKNHDWSTYSLNDCFVRVRKIYDSYKAKDNLIVACETTQEYKDRVTDEIRGSKVLLEKMLDKPVLHVCWPHGDYNDFCHETAISQGYKSSHIVLKPGQINLFPDRFDRTGSSTMRNNRLLTLMKARYKLGAYRRKLPWSVINNAYMMFR